MITCDRKLTPILIKAVFHSWAKKKLKLVRIFSAHFFPTNQSDCRKEMRDELILRQYGKRPLRNKILSNGPATWRVSANQIALFQKLAIHWIISVITHAYFDSKSQQIGREKLIDTICITINEIKTHQIRRSDKAKLVGWQGSSNNFSV